MLVDGLERVTVAINRHAEGGGAGQLYVSVRATVVADHAWGASARGGDMRTDTLVRWASAVKVATAVGAARLWERGGFDLDDRVVRYVPDFGANGKEHITVRHLLTHTGHLGGYAGPFGLGTWDETIAAICAAPREQAMRGLSDSSKDGSVPPAGTAPAYNPAGTWMLAEVCRRIDGRPHEQFIRDEVFLPCAMDDSWNGMPAARFEAYGDRVGGPRHDRIPPPTLESVAVPQPAGGGIGPSRDLGRFYEGMLARGKFSSGQLLTAQTVDAMTARHTDGPIYWGLGFNRQPPAGQSAAASSAFAGYSRYASPRTFGHNGATGMVAFADPEHGLVAVGISPGLSWADLLYEDLDLTATKGSGE